MTLFMVYLLVTRYAALMVLRFFELLASTMQKIGDGLLGTIGATLADFLQSLRYTNSREFGLGLLGAIGVVVASEEFGPSAAQEIHFDDRIRPATVVRSASPFTDLAGLAQSVIETRQHVQLEGRASAGWAALRLR